MNSDEHRQLIASIFDALAQGDAAPFVDAMADDFRWEFPGQWSWARDWGHTKNEIRSNMLRPLMSQFADYRSRADEIIAAGDRVIVRASAEATTTRGDAYPQSYCYLFTVRNGQLTKVVEYCDTALVERVLKLPDQA